MNIEQYFTLHYDAYSAILENDGEEAAYATRVQMN